MVHDHASVLSIAIKRIFPRPTEPYESEKIKGWCSLLSRITEVTVAVSCIAMRYFMTRGDERGGGGGVERERSLRIAAAKT